MSEIMSDDDKTVIMASWLPVVVHFYVITVWSEKASFCQGSRSRTIYSTYKLLMRDLQVHMKYKLKLHIHMNQPTSDELFNLLKWMIIILWGSISHKLLRRPLSETASHLEGWELSVGVFHRRDIPSGSLPITFQIQIQIRSGSSVLSAAGVLSSAAELGSSTTTRRWYTRGKKLKAYLYRRFLI